MPAPVVRISVYSDYTCPWCFIGMARVDRLREELEGEVDLHIKWMPFEIHPEVPEEGAPIEILGYPKEQFRQMTEYLRSEAAKEGLTVAEHERIANTHRALAAGTYAQDREPEYFEGFHHRLFTAYFSEGRNIGDPEVIRELARECGLDVSAMDAALAESTYDDAIEATGDIARRLGITGTPTFVIDNTYGVVGAHPVEVLRRAVLEVLASNGNARRSSEGNARRPSE